jgi:hypothetical protein
MVPSKSGSEASASAVTGVLSVRITSLFGLPAHVFLVHIPVILVPLVAGGTVLVLWPSMRRRFGWALVVLAGAALVATVLATESGKALRHYVTSTSLVRAHTRLGGNLTVWAVLLFGLVAATVVWDHVTRPRLDARSDGPGAVATIDIAGHSVTPTVVQRVAVALGVLSVLVAGVSTYWVYRIGHTGATAVWTTVQHRIDTGQQVGGDSGR